MAYEFQDEGIKYLQKNRCALLADEPGLGKSRQTILGLPEGCPVLIICPKSAIGVWIHETGLWRPGVWKIRPMGSKVNFRWPEHGEMLIATYDSIPPEPGIWPLVGTAIVWDEIHMLKSKNAQRTNRSRSLARLARSRDGRTWGLTGTPLLNKGDEAWNILEILDLHKKAYGSRGAFVEAFGGRTVQKRMWAGRGKMKTIYSYEWDMPITPAAKAGLERVYLRRTQEEVLPQLPPAVFDDILIPLDYKGKQALREMEGALKQAGISLAELIQIIEEGKERRGFDIGILAKARQALAIAKIPTMLDYAEASEATSQPLVIFSDHRAPVEAFEGREGWGVIHGDVSAAKRKQIVDAFQAGELSGVAATIGAAGVALTLTRSSHCLFVDKGWVPALNRQAWKRLHRISQVNFVQITSLIYDHPVEIHLHGILLKKTILENSVLG